MSVSNNVPDVDSGCCHSDLFIDNCRVRVRQHVVNVLAALAVVVKVGNMRTVRRKVTPATVKQDAPRLGRHGGNAILARHAAAVIGIGVVTQKDDGNVGCTKLLARRRLQLR